MSNKFFVDYRWPSLWWDDYDGKTVAQFKAALATDEALREQYLQEKRNALIGTKYEERAYSLELKRDDPNAPNFQFALDYLNGYMMGGEGATIHLMTADWSTDGFLCRMYVSPELKDIGGDKFNLVLRPHPMVIGLVPHGDGRWGTHT